jgi:5,10-methenyltetrahydrofolate synthetase
LETDAARKLQRQRLLETRDALADRPQKEAALAKRVGVWLARADVHAVGFFWPFRGEPDLRPVLAAWLAAEEHRVAALPVIARDVLEFHQWVPDAPMRAGTHGIPVPAHGRAVQPDCLLIPCVGFDAAHYRIGYGGGFYDRTLISLVPWPLTVGIAFDATRVDSIDPRPHDVRLDAVLTDAAEY